MSLFPAKFRKLLGHVAFLIVGLAVGGIAGYFIGGCMDAVGDRYPDMPLTVAFVLLTAIVIAAFFPIRTPASWPSAKAAKRRIRWRHCKRPGNWAQKRQR